MRLEKAMEQNIKFNSDLLNETAMEISTKPSDVVVDGKLAKQIELLWQTSEIQKLFEHYTEREGNGTIHPSTRWFFENLERISKKEYIPSVEDVIRVRFRTTGIVEQVISFSATFPNKLSKTMKRKSALKITYK